MLIKFSPPHPLQLDVAYKCGIITRIRRMLSVVECVLILFLSPTRSPAWGEHVVIEISILRVL